MSDTRSSPQLPASLAGRWRMAGQLGKGGQGAVYRIDTLDGLRSAALKLLLKKGDYQVERLRREIEVMQSIAHPNVVPILEFGFDPIPYYVMPTGQPMTEFWESRLALEPAQRFDDSYAVLVALPSL
jgi:serine/threonine protein kinase